MNRLTVKTYGDGDSYMQNGSYYKDQRRLYRKQADGAATSTREETDLHLHRERSTVKINSEKFVQHEDIAQSAYVMNKEMTLRRFVTSTNRQRQ